MRIRDIGFLLASVFFSPACTGSLAHWTHPPHLKGLRALASNGSDSTKIFRNELRSKVDSKIAWIRCYRLRELLNQGGAESCYRRVIEDAFDELSNQYRDRLGNFLESEREVFLSENEWGRVQEQVMDELLSQLDEVLPQLDRHTDSLWNRCMQVPSDGTSIDSLKSPFSVDTQFLSSSMLNCINSLIGPYLTYVRSRVADQFIDREIRPIAENIFLERAMIRLKERLKSGTERERQQLRSLKNLVVGRLADGMTHDRRWVPSEPQRDAIMTACREESQNRFKPIFTSAVSQKRQTAEMQLRFHDVNELAPFWSESACDRVLRSAELIQHLKAHEKDDWYLALGSLDSLIRAKAAEEMSECRQRFSENSLVHKKSRIRCLYRAWERLEDEAIEEWDSTEFGQYFSARRREAVEFLIQKRKQIRSDTLRFRGSSI